MKTKFFAFVITLILTIPTVAQQSNSEDKIKAYINDVVQKVEKTNVTSEKRVVLNESFEKLINVFEKVEKMEKFSKEERSGIAELKKAMMGYQSELNGENGFTPVPNNQLNDFANFVQQDLEQADTLITISAGLAVIIVLLLLLI